MIDNKISIQSQLSLRKLDDQLVHGPPPLLINEWKDLLSAGEDSLSLGTLT